MAKIHCLAQEVMSWKPYFITFQSDDVTFKI